MKSWKCRVCFWTNAASEKHCKRVVPGTAFYCGVPRKAKKSR